MTEQEVNDLVAFATNFEPADLASEYQQELAYRIAQEVRIRIQKSGLSFNDFAEQHGLKAPQLSRQLSGTHNFTLKSVAKIAAAIKEPLLSVCSRPSFRFEAVGQPSRSRSLVDKESLDVYEYVVVESPIGSSQPSLTSAKRGRLNTSFDAKMLKADTNDSLETYQVFNVLPIDQSQNSGLR